MLPYYRLILYTFAIYIATRKILKRYNQKIFVLSGFRSNDTTTEFES